MNLKPLIAIVLGVALSPLVSAANIDLTGDGGSNLGNAVNFNSGGFTGTITATDSNGNTSGVSGFSLDGYGVAAGGYRSIQGNETLRIDFDQLVDIGSIHLRQWEGPDDAKITSFFGAGGSSILTHTADNGGAFDTNEHISLNLTGVSYVEVSGIYTGAIFGIPKTQFFVAGFDNVTASPVPVPAAVWLFGSALFGLFGVARRRSANAA